MTDALPTFIYHPDPLATGSVVQADTVCVCCQRQRGHVYSGPVHAQGAHENEICPWCIADGSAHAQLGASFTDEDGIGNGLAWSGDAVPQAVIEQVAHRTPGFSGWQQESWWTHCGDAAQYLGRAGHAELLAAGAEAVEAIRDTTALEGAEWARFFAALKRDGSPTAYLFRCRHCGQWGGYQDAD